MPLNHNTAQMQFERNKDDKRTQALLVLLGKTHKQVCDWNIHVTTTGTWYKVVFHNGDEMRGFIFPAAVEGEYIASGTVVPAESVKAVRAREGRWP
jgi:hypothetical protein